MLKKVNIGMEKGYKISKTVIKAIEVFIEGGLGAVISFLTGLPPTETIIFTIAILTAILNAWKHRA